MFDETLLWVLLGVLTLTTIALVITLVRTRHRDDERPIGQHAASNRATETSRNPSPHGQPTGQTSRPGSVPASHRATGTSMPASSPSPSESSTDQGGEFSLLRMNPEERARLRAAASHYEPRDSPPGPTPFTSRAALAARAQAPAPPPPPPPGVIRGYVRQAGGSVIQSASLTLIDLAGGQIGRGVTGSDGAYSLPTPGPGSYFLIARARGHHPQASTVTVTDQPVTLGIVLTGLAELWGVVRIAGGQEPVPSALVTLLDVRGEVIGSTTTDHHGRYQFAELVGGTFTLAASASPFSPVAHQVTVSDSGASAYDIDLHAGAYVRGTVIAGPERRGFGDARVT
ncbi:MAG: MSCRAMM family protein, partial [Micromonosporaceae bacterium]